jgi:two-component system chemotaxis response regulator CheB
MARANVLICEDSGIYAAALRRTLEYDGDINVVGICGTAEEAISLLPRFRPDLVTMDIELPGMDGLAAVELIMGTRPVPILVLSSHVSTGNVKAAAALAAGALDAVAKDDLDLSSPAGVAGAALRHRIRMISNASVIRHPRASMPADPPATCPPRSVSVIGICSSAGGPQVLAEVLGALPDGYPVPILVVQHISAGFIESLARWLDQKAPVSVQVAQGDTAIRPGVWIAPEGAHLLLGAGGRLKLDRATVAGHHRPSGDVLLTSIAETAGRRGAAIVLTGMGNDGAAGAAAVNAAGGLAISQDEASSAIFGMPRAALERGVDIALPPDRIAKCLLTLRYKPLPGLP